MLDIGEIVVEEEVELGNVELDVIKVEPEYEEIKIIPSNEEQVKEGSFNKVTVVGDENLKAENINKGTAIFGVEGTAKTTGIKITNASYLFYNRARLEYLNEFLALCENVTNMNSMFYYCDNLTNLDLSDLDTSNVTNMNYMFQNCSKLEHLNMKNFNTSKLTELRYTFSGCESLQSLDLSNFETSNVTNFYEMFIRCKKMVNLNVSSFDTRNATNVTGMFRDCISLVSLDLSNFDLSKVSSVSSFLTGLSALENLKSFKNLGKAYTTKSQNSSSYKLDLSGSPLLTHESLMDIINNLYDLNLSYNVANGGTLYRQALVLGNTNLAKLTADEIAIATNKGWNVS